MNLQAASASGSGGIRGGWLRGAGRTDGSVHGLVSGAGMLVGGVQKDMLAPPAWSGARSPSPSWLALRVMDIDVAADSTLNLGRHGTDASTAAFSCCDSSGQPVWCPAVGA